MVINLTNHPSENWDMHQWAAAQEYGQVVDMTFPLINPIATSAEITVLAQDFAQRIADMLPRAVLCQGEFSFVFALVTEIKKRGIIALTACSERIVQEYEENGTKSKVAIFKFVQFRKY